MGQRLTQPEEIDQILKEMQEDERRLVMPLPEQRAGSGLHLYDWTVGYVSPYRAAYLKSQCGVGH